MNACFDCAENDLQLHMGPMSCAEQRPVLIVFDLDGTIADSRELARVCYQRLFEVLGYGRISDELADSFNGPDADEVCRVMGIGPDKRPLYDELVDEIGCELTRTIGRMFPDIDRMLQTLAPHARLSILTNGSANYCAACIETFALAPYLSISSGFVSGVSKAQRIAMWERELNARRVIVVGDRCTDISNARAVGAYAIGVTYGMGSREELSGADCLCDTPMAVARECMRVIAEA